MTSFGSDRVMVLDGGERTELDEPTRPIPAQTSIIAQRCQAAGVSAKHKGGLLHLVNR